MQTNASTYVDQINALRLIEDIVADDVGTDIAAIVLARDPRSIETALGVALGLLRSALDARPGRSVAKHLEMTREAMEARDIDLGPMT